MILQECYQVDDVTGVAIFKEGPIEMKVTALVDDPELSIWNGEVHAKDGLLQNILDRFERTGTSTYRGMGWIVDLKITC